MRNYATLALAVTTVAAGAVLAFSAPALARSDSSSCLDPSDPRSYEAEIPNRNGGTITTKDGRPLCSDGDMVLQSFNVPDTWNKEGWNKTAIPQTQYASTEFTFPANTSDHSITVKVDSPDPCKHTQLDFYVAPGYEKIDTLTGDDALNVAGILFAATETCKEEPKEIQVCLLKDKKIITIKEDEFDSALHSKDLDDCDTPVVQPKDIQVCVLKDKTIKTIKEDAFDSALHSKNLDDCKKVEEDKGKGGETPKVLPSTGLGSIIGSVTGAGSLASAGYYYYNSRRRLMK